MNSLEKKQILIEPTYLVEVSNSVETLNHFYEQEGIGSLSNEYRNLLVSSFGNLNQNLQIYSNSEDASSMVQAAVIKCKADIQIYCLDKLAFLLSRETEELGKIISHAAHLYRNNIDDFQRILLSQRRKRIQMTENQKDATIQKLKSQLTFRKQYIAELKQRLNEVEQQNSGMYQKMIGNMKNISDRALSISPKKNNSNSVIMNSSLAKLKSEALLGTAHKTLSSKQVQQTIIDIMQTKQKQQTVKGKKSSLKSFLKTYFRYKFGMKDLADQLELNFREAVEFFSNTQQKNIFILFIKMCAEQCEQQFYWDQKVFYDKLSKLVKRYLNAKDGIPLDQLNKTYDNKVSDDRPDVNLNDKDVQYILINIYKTSEVDSLQMILNEILLPKIQATDQVNHNEPLLIPSKKLMNQIMNYELNRHLLKIEDIVKAIRDIDDSRGYLNQQDLETVIVRLNVPQDKIQANFSMLNSYQNKFITHSQAIQVIQKIRKFKPKKK